MKKLMERSREARRSSSSSMATGNGQPKRRHRSNSLRDSPGMYFIRDCYEFMYVFVCMYVNFVSFCCRGSSGGVARGGEVT